MGFVSGVTDFFAGIQGMFTGIVTFIVDYFVTYWYISLPILFGAIWWYTHKWK